MKSKEKVGILGGTFNPVHNGHIQLGLKVMQRFNLGKILYILSALPPHKNGSGIVKAPVRWEMLTSALEPYNALIPSDIEINRNSFSWTIDTVKSLKDFYCPESLFFISGSEGFLKIRTWKNYKELLRSINFIILMREDSQLKDVMELLSSEGINFTRDISLKKSFPAAYLFSYKSDIMNISSTMIRERVRAGSDISGFVPETINKFISEHHLYE